jgi:hypothetical protein
LDEMKSQYASNGIVKFTLSSYDTNLTSYDITTSLH